MVLRTFNLKILLRITLKIFLFFYPFPLFSQEQKVAYPFFTPCMLINKDNLSIQQKDVTLNKSGNVSESPPIGYGDCATHLFRTLSCKKQADIFSQKLK